MTALERPLKKTGTMNNERTNGLLGFLAGAAVGAALGVLLAPRSGKETRDRIRGRVKDAKDDVDEFIDRAQGEWAKAKGKATHAATMTRDEVTDFVRFLFEEGRDLKERLAEDVDRSAEDVGDHARRAADKVRHSAN